MKEYDTIFAIQTVGTPNPEDIDGLERRAYLIDSNLSTINQAFQQAVSARISEPFVFILDLTDKLAAFVHRKLNDVSEVDQDKVIRECKAKNAIPTGYAIQTRWNAYKAMCDIQKLLHKMNARNPEVSEVVEQFRNPAEADHFYCLCISQGKAYVELPVPSGIRWPIEGNRRA